MSEIRFRVGDRVCLYESNFFGTVLEVDKVGDIQVLLDGNVEAAYHYAKYAVPEAFINSPLAKALS